MIIHLLVLIACVGMIGTAYGQAGSSFDQQFRDVKFLDAYFGTPEEKIEVSPGDQNVPFTVVMANVGTNDITGIKGQLSLPFGLESSSGQGRMSEADSESNSVAGQNFALTFFVNVGEHISIGNHPASVKIDYSRLRESGHRNAFFDFEFKVTGSSVINMKAQDPFLISLKENHIVIEITNDGTAPASGMDVELQNTQGTISSTAQSVTNTENVVILDSHWDIGHLGPGATKQLKFAVYVPESLKGETLRTPMMITYFNAHGDRQTITRIVDFYVKGFIDVSIYNVDVIELSGRQTVIGEIINEGNEDALFGFVSVEPLGDSNIKPSTQFIDEIEVDSPVPFNVPIEFDGEPQYGEHDILVTVRYKDDVRDETFVTHEATITVADLTSKNQEEPNYVPLVLIPIVLGIGFLVYKKMRAKKS